MNKKGSLGKFFLVMLVSLLIAAFWNKFPFIKNTAHAILNPTAGALLSWNITGGMIIVILIISLAITLAQKYGTDQKELRKLREEQKILQEEMKKFKNHPEKFAELSKKQMEFIPKTMDLSMRPIIYTSLPLILFFRWFNDYFTVFSEFKFFGFFSWFWFYLLGTLVFSSIFRKVFDVV